MLHILREFCEKALRMGERSNLVSESWSQGLPGSGAVRRLVKFTTLIFFAEFERENLLCSIARCEQ